MAIPAWRASQLSKPNLILIPKPQRPRVAVGTWLFWVVFILLVVAWNVAAAWKFWQIVCVVGEKFRGLIP
jgi:hypothetical protein